MFFTGYFIHCSFSAAIALMVSGRKDTFHIADIELSPNNKARRVLEIFFGLVIDLFMFIQYICIIFKLWEVFHVLNHLITKLRAYICLYFPQYDQLWGNLLQTMSNFLATFAFFWSNVWGNLEQLVPFC